MTDVLSMLEALADARAERDELSADIDRQIRELEEIQATRCFEVDQRIDSLTRSIKSATLSLQASEKGSRLHAIYTKGRTTWDGALLKGYAVAHPEINEFKKVGKPSVSIRPVR